MARYIKSIKTSHGIDLYSMTVFERRTWIMWYEFWYSSKKLYSVEWLLFLVADTTYFLYVVSLFLYMCYCYSFFPEPNCDWFELFHFHSVISLPKFGGSHTWSICLVGMVTVLYILESEMNIKSKCAFSYAVWSTLSALTNWSMISNN